ncbi:Hsp70 family protein [Desulfoferrobacter suflitae]|uniref:Hsp70 family protein n=1 Tax=Desulfoferrobacter suflitae TaxID=2865782 RepID=UPI002164B090|nr:Hsp70 family protein [Desulfoferrobacter suflitae]MCK8603892.1 hsp70 family protein [Desulfoferrobacter suflitae]
MESESMDNQFEYEDLSHRYIIGIDLGTTNSAVAYVDLSRNDASGKTIQFFDIPQLIAPGEVGRRPVLPSFLYLRGPHDLPRESIQLPWNKERNYAVGEFAREQGALVPGRMVSSAKSWLCHAGVDRTRPILPWGAGQDVNKISPVEASARYLQHIREAWNETRALGREGHRLEQQLIILTVPASFDEVARELTVDAARHAGLTRVVLVEEPLAAFYAWLYRHENDWQDAMRANQIILVCDVGGGTTDFTIVAIRAGDKGLRFDRLAVGDHLMLGGDNMDLALARHIEMKLLGQPGKLDSKRWLQLWHQCRKAKEVLLGETTEPESSFDITVMGTGGRLIADTMKSSLTLEQVQQMIVDGFFPLVSLQDSPRGGRRKGLTEWGLPYVQDAAVTRHLGSFWQRFQGLLGDETGRSALYPDFVLFNGGALTPVSIRRRILQVVQQWFAGEAETGWTPIELENPRPELAVAVGAAYYGLVRLGEGVRIGAGSPRAYYVEVAAQDSSAADEQQRQAVCLIPRGTEEGFETHLEEPNFQVLTNQPVAFQLLSSSTRLGDRLGQVVIPDADEITVLPPIRTVLRFGKRASAQLLPISLGVHLTEVGTLELWCESRQTPHRWQLQFDVRQEAEPEGQLTPGETLDTDLIDRGLEKIRATFQGGDSMAQHPPEKLVRELAAIFDLGKEKWPALLIRKLADTLIEYPDGRLLTAHHEARWLNLLGFCLRPGFGDPVDEWRMKEAWKLYPQGIEFHRQAQNRSEWWIFWRRIAGGLSAGQQLHIYQQLAPSLQPAQAKKKKGGKKAGKSFTVQEEIEVWMMLANFERLPADKKAQLGDTLVTGMDRKKPRPQELWAVGRFGARIPLYGPLDQVVHSRQAVKWLDSLLSMNLTPSEPLARTLIQLARLTGDRERDIPEEKRDYLAGWLDQLPQASRFRQMLTHPETMLQSREQDWVFGESLPAGLVLSG